MVDNVDFLSIGDKIEIKLSNKKGNVIYSSQVLDILKGKQYIISGPISKSTLVPLHINEKVKLFYYKKNLGRFSLNAIIKNRETSSIYKLMVEQIGDIEKVQERDYFRLWHMLKASKSHLIENNINIEEACMTVDISGGGLKLLCNFNHNISDKLEIKVETNDLKISCIGEVVRISDSNSIDYKHILGVKFTQISKEDREKIVRFIFNEQRKLRKKGLI